MHTRFQFAVHNNDGIQMRILKEFMALNIMFIFKRFIAKYIRISRRSYGKCCLVLFCMYERVHLPYAIGNFGKPLSAIIIIVVGTIASFLYVYMCCAWMCRALLSLRLMAIELSRCFLFWVEWNLIVEPFLRFFIDVRESLATTVNDESSVDCRSVHNIVRRAMLCPATLPHQYHHPVTLNRL